MTEQRMPLYLKIPICIYLLTSADAPALALTDPSNDPLAAVYLVLVAMPWILTLEWLNRITGLDSYAFNIVYACLCVCSDAGLLYLLGRSFRRLRT